ncbi:MAG: DUF177 domain-containing protein [Gemmatimonadetes bacterium]|nr:DUF177 domain-containing protein [Gemmatimonadota bacterium]
MLQVDLRELARGPVETTGDLAVGDPLFEGLGFVLAEPVVVGGKLQATGEGRFYWHGSLRTAVVGECRRCLTPLAVGVRADVGALFSQEPEALDDAEAYPLAPDAVEVDVRVAVREELILAVPRYLECRVDCRGLCPRCGQDLNAGSCGCPPATDLRWTALAALKDKLRD